MTMFLPFRLLSVNASSAVVSQENSGTAWLSSTVFSCNGLIKVADFDGILADWFLVAALMYV